MEIVLAFIVLGWCLIQLVRVAVKDPVFLKTCLVLVYLAGIVWVILRFGRQLLP